MSLLGAPVPTTLMGSVDSPADMDKARQFIAQHPPLAYFADPDMKLPFALKPGEDRMCPSVRS